MSNYIEKLSNHQPIATNQQGYNKPKTASNPMLIHNERQQEKIGSNILERFLQNQGVMASAKVNAIDNVYKIQKPYKNNLRSMFQNNEAVIMGVIIRNLGAKDNKGNQLIREGDERGTLVNAVNRLPELKRLGINTLHVLPLHPVGKENAMGTAGSVYAPLKFVEDNGDFAIDPEIIDENPPKEARKEIETIYNKLTGRELVKMDKNDPNVRAAQTMYFVNKCHELDIKVMPDMPSCISYTGFKNMPELMSFEKDGTPKTPAGWVDIRTLNSWQDKSKRILNPHIVKMFKNYVDGAVKLGFDGIRADVAREKPTELWDMTIKYSHEKDPEFAWLAESYTYEDASPQLNIEKDRPKDALNAGFDSYYGQWHIFHEMKNATEVIDYVKENLEMSRELPPGKSLIGSFGTHDDISIMNHGGVDYVNLVSGMQATLPMLNPYYFDGYQSGDYYMYDFENQKDKQTETDSDECTVHKSKPDIFNYSRPLIGEYPEIGEFMKNTLDVRSNPKYHKVLTLGSFIPLKVENNKDDQIITFLRHYKGKTLLVVANKDVNSTQTGSIEIPGLKETQKLNNLFNSYGASSILQAQNNRLNVELGKGRVHLFEIDIPDIETRNVEVLRQNLIVA